MAAYKTQPAQLHSFTDAAYAPYSSQSFQPQQADNTASQLDGLAFAANGAATQYLNSETNSSPVNIISCSPNAGSAGTRVELKVTSQYDLMAMSAQAPYIWLSFGSQRCHAEAVKEGITHDGVSVSYIVSAEAPQFIMTNCASQSNVLLTLIIENTNCEEVARVPVAQSFSYHDSSINTTSSMGGTADNVTAGAPEDITRKSPAESPGHGESPPQLTARTSTTSSPHEAHNPLSTDSNTNTFSYPHNTVDAATAAAAAAQQVQQAQTNFAAAAAAASSYSQDNSNMLGAYRSASFSDGFQRHAGPPPLRNSIWNGYSNSISHQGHHPHDRYGSIARNDSITQGHSTASITRPSLHGALSAPGSSNVPQLIRTSTIQSGSPGLGVGGVSGYGNGHWGSYSTKAVLSILGNLDSMAQEWTPEEWNSRRRIVLFHKKQNGCHLEATFRAVPINERPPNSICISCIYWAEKQECFVTSVDTINLLEQLVAQPSRFSVEEKNRIRRNLEGFKPVTVSKAKTESEEFFKLIMGFGAPKPRTIEKDVKVFPWKILGQALKKIISKYSASPSSILPHSSSGSASNHHMLTPVTMSPSYAGLPPTPGSVSAGTDGTSNVGYMTVATGPTPSESLASPRSLSGTSATWMSYAQGPSGRPISPGTTISKPQSPSTVGLRMSALPTAYDSRGAANVTHGMPPASQAYGMHHHQTHNFNSPLPVTTASGGSTATHTTSSATSHGVHNSNGRWDTYDVTNSGQSYSNGHHQHGHHTQLYAGHYGDGGQRA
ncbi:transcriptional regulator medusa [Grosmannia clavigera kw1407]|uniref:Transcriptional regulator medusa n=1 Tax=Grosmannia clavigera (strain kw1407 / UAMH 11150) TaxID=655863 RepID=F0XIT7_GROCL|nr:transcriptional regulator medusa [Grosmannia clavigera kw1407]EFX02202.1 transcriptional regulator medusa [Grosmannia clavigera kw1407]